MRTWVVHLGPLDAGQQKRLDYSISAAKSHYKLEKDAKKILFISNLIRVNLFSLIFILRYKTIIKQILLES